ncbi:major royal jelly family protein [Rhizobium rhizogenes]|uniref:L-dopachrome tautomerase-related protein n=1 Tax=Rhizobium rhizogenes TaxID=359 RepID=UPI003ECEA913
MRAADFRIRAQQVKRGGKPMTITRRLFMVGMGAVSLGGGAVPCPSFAADAQLPLSIAAKSPWMANQVALTSRNVMFLGLPRFPGHEETPSVAKRQSDGSVVPFPGGSWNNWKAGDDGQDAFVYVNSVHIFSDDTVWCVDQGALRADASSKELATPKPGAQKLVQLNPDTGEVLRVIRFGDDILPPGAKMNDLRIYGDTIYITDSGLGAIIVHDLKTGKTLRRLSARPEMLATPSPEPQTTPGKSRHATPKSDLIEVSTDGAWLYWASPTGPFRRISTRVLHDRTLDDDALVSHVEKVTDTPLVGGSAMDTQGNLYLSDLRAHRIILMTPAGQQTIITADPGLVSPDGGFISVDRHLYIPAPQTERTELFGHPKDMTEKPFLIYAIQLPETFDSIRLGGPVTGRHV